MGCPCRKAVNDPSALASGLHHLSFAKIGEVLGDLGLRQLENLLKMADAERALREKVDDPQPDGFAEALVNLDQFHEVLMKYALKTIYVKVYICSR